MPSIEPLVEEQQRADTRFRSPSMKLILDVSAGDGRLFVLREGTLEIFSLAEGTLLTTFDTDAKRVWAAPAQALFALSDRFGQLSLLYTLKDGSPRSIHNFGGYGGFQVAWNHDGTQLFYDGAGNDYMSFREPTAVLQLLVIPASYVLSGTGVFGDWENVPTSFAVSPDNELLLVAHDRLEIYTLSDHERTASLGEVSDARLIAIAVLSRDCVVVQDETGTLHVFSLRGKLLGDRIAAWKFSRPLRPGITAFDAHHVLAVAARGKREPPVLIDVRDGSMMELPEELDFASAPSLRANAEQNTTPVFDGTLLWRWNANALRAYALPPFELVHEIPLQSPEADGTRAWWNNEGTHCLVRYYNDRRSDVYELWDFSQEFPVRVTRESKSEELLTPVGKHVARVTPETNEVRIQLSSPAHSDFTLPGILVEHGAEHLLIKESDTVLYVYSLRTKTKYQLPPGWDLSKEQLLTEHSLCTIEWRTDAAPAEPSITWKAFRFSDGTLVSYGIHVPSSLRVRRVEISACGNFLAVLESSKDPQGKRLIVRIYDLFTATSFPLIERTSDEFTDAPSLALGSAGRQVVLYGDELLLLDGLTGKELHREPNNNRNNADVYHAPNSERFLLCGRCVSYWKP